MRLSSAAIIITLAVLVTAALVGVAYAVTTTSTVTSTVTLSSTTTKTTTAYSLGTTTKTVRSTVVSTVPTTTVITLTNTTTLYLTFTTTFLTTTNNTTATVTLLSTNTSILTATQTDTTTVQSVVTSTAYSVITSTSTISQTSLLSGSVSASFVTNSPLNSSQWMVLEAPSAPASVSASNLGTVPKMSSLSALNATTIGYVCIATVTKSSTCGSFQLEQQTGWFFDSVHGLLYIHYVGGSNVVLNISEQGSTSSPPSSPLGLYAVVIVIAAAGLGLAVRRKGFPKRRHA